MTELTNQVAGKTWAKSAARTGWTILIAATLYVCYFSHLGAIGFVGPDEPRYAWVARDMAQTGDWVTPHLYGKPWFEKPPLFYWGAALCFKLFGVSEAAARLPSAICALLATLALAWLALRLYGAETARWLLLLLPTTVGMIGFSHAAATDMPFSGMLTIAMVAAAVVLGLTKDENAPILPRTPWVAFVLFGFFLGLAVLAKGPAAIILCGGAVFFWALFTKRWRDAFRLLHPVAIATFCLTALPWYILCAHRNPDFLRVFIIEHNFKRYLTPEFQHIQPFWFFLPVLFIGSFPWNLLLVQDYRHQFHLERQKGTTANFFFVLHWILFPILFFSLSRSKLPGYVLPALPPLFLILSQRVAEFIHMKVIPRLKLGVALISGFPSIMVLTACLEMWHLWKGKSPSHLIASAGAIAFAGIIACLILALRNQLAASMLSSVIATLGLVFVITYYGGLWLDPWFSSRTVGTIALPHDEAEANQCAYGLKRSWLYGMSYYRRRELRVCELSSQESFLAYVDAYALDKLRASCVPFYVLDKRSPDALLVLVRPANSACSPPRCGQAQ